MANALYGTFEFITSDYVVAGAKMRLGIKNSTEDDLYLKDLCNTGVKRLRNLLTLVPAVAQLPIVGGKAKLPQGFVKFPKGNYPIIYVNSAGVADPANIRGIAPINNNNPFFTDTPFPIGQGFYPYGGICNVENGYLFFEGEITAQNVKIVYLSTNIDLDGEVQIPAIAEDTLVAFICWQYGLTIGNNPNLTATSERTFKSGKQWLKGLSAMPESNENPYLYNQMNKLP